MLLHEKAATQTVCCLSTGLTTVLRLPLFRFFFHPLSFSLELLSILFHFSLFPPALRLLALAILLALLELPEPARPRVPPLDDQAAFVRHHSALAGGVLVVAQQQVLLPGLDLGTLAGHVLGADPQELVAAADAALALLVDGDDVDGELPPLARLVSFQHVHLDSCWRRRGKPGL